MVSNKCFYRTNVLIKSMPKKGPDSKKLSEITGILEDAPGGLWTREIARRAEMSKSTVSRYLNKHLAEQVEEKWMGRNRVFRLKGKEGDGVEE